VLTQRRTGYHGSQPTPRVGKLNMNRHRRNVVLKPIGSTSGMLADESGSSHMLLTHQPLRRSKSPSLGKTRVLARAPKRPRSRIIQTRLGIKPEMQPDGQGHFEPLHFSDDSHDEYQNSCNADENGLETEVNVDASDISEGPTSRQHHWSLVSHKPGNGHQPVV